MPTSVRHTQLLPRCLEGDGKARQIAAYTLRKLQLCATDSLTARFAASGIFAAAILLAAYLAARIPLDL